MNWNRSLKIIFYVRSQDFRKRKFVWITSSIIILVSIITISIVIFHLKKTNLENTSTQSTTEITRTNQPLTTTRKGRFFSKEDKLLFATIHQR
jgi:uncharacterized protein YpmB